MSPNQPDPSDPTKPFLRPSDLDPTLDEYDNPRIHGALEYEAARDLYARASEPVSGGVHARQRYVEFQNLPVDPSYAGAKGATTCIVAIGAGFLAGSEEGSPAAPGNYRILHRGVAKQSMLGLFAQYVPFTGASRVFRVD